MDPLMIWVYLVILVAVIILFIVVYKYGMTEMRQPESKHEIDPVDKIKAILKDLNNNSQVIHDAMYRYISMKDLKNPSKAQMNEALHILLLYLKHPQCNAKLFADVLLDLEKRYPDYKYQFEAMGDQALIERKHQQKERS